MEIWQISVYDMDIKMTRGSFRIPQALQRG
jgi:hypothetical protein